MNSEEFITEITKLKPDKQEFNRPSSLDELIIRWLSMFDIKSKNLTAAFDDPIINLIKNSHVSSLNINEITFDPELYEDEDFIFIGWDMNDRLGILKSNWKIVAYDSYSGRIMFECAETSSKFLDALVEIMRFFREKIVNDYEEEERDRRAVHVAYIAALKAGGEQYENYYKSILCID